MKQYITFLLIVLAGIVLYTIYGLVTFTKEEPRSFAFSEPKLPADLILKDEQNTPEAKQQNVAVEEAQKAVTLYREAQKAAPEKANDTLALLIDRMTNSDLPMYFLSGPNPNIGNLRTFETLTINTDSKIEAENGNNKVLNCSSKTPVAKIIVGTAGKDIISCDSVRDVTGAVQEADVMLIGGPENDQITDVHGNRIINGGTGDDLIKLGPGRSIIVLDASWGKDKLEVDCTGATIAPNEIPAGFPIPWLNKTMNFIVLGNSLNPKDLEWRGNALTHKTTGDTLTVNQACFTVVPPIQ